VTTRTWTVTMPTTTGTYEFRLFLNNGYTRAATSPPITVTPGPNPVPSIGSLSPVRAPAGSGPVTLTVNGSGFVSGSVVQWHGAARQTTSVSDTQLQAASGGADGASVGMAQVTVSSPTPGGGTSAAAPSTIAPPPALGISASPVQGGTSETVTLTNGVGG